MRRLLDRLRQVSHQLHRIDLLQEMLATRSDALMVRLDGLMEQNTALAQHLATMEREQATREADLQARVSNLQMQVSGLSAQVDNSRHIQRVLTDRLREALGQVQSEQRISKAGVTDPPAVFAPVEFRVFSQFNEDGVLQFLLRQIAVPSKTFIEFGVENYEEATTRFLLMNDNWTGLVFDGDPENISFLERTPHYWRSGLTAAAEFITRENINDLFRRYGMQGEIGLLCIDIDGNDYWVWDAIEAVRPAIVCCEYNWRFGPDARVTVPYDPAFVREKAHPSLIYFGASLAALVALGKRKGYAFVGCESHGVNAFFVREDLRPATLPERTVAEGYIAASVHETRNDQGEMIKWNAEEQRRLVESLPLVSVESE